MGNSFSRRKGRVRLPDDEAASDHVHFSGEPTSRKGPTPPPPSPSAFVLVLIDGDGLIFADHHMRKGYAGGFAAARTLYLAIRDVAAMDISRSTSEILVGPRVISTPSTKSKTQRGQSHGQKKWNIVINVFLNKKGLQGVLARSGLDVAAIEAFWDGLSGAHELLSVIDVGHMKEGADAKIKAQMDLFASVPDCKTIFAGVTHDHSYMTTLNSLSTEGRRDKFLLLKGFHKIAPGIKALHLPTVAVQDLFRSEALIVPKGPIASSTVVAPDLMTDGEEPTTAESVASDNSSTHSLDRAEQLLRKIFDEEGGATLPGPGPELEADQDITLIGNGIPQTQMPEAASTHAESKRVSGSVRTLKPRPCHAHYLTVACPRTDDRSHLKEYGHDYDLTPDQRKELRKLVKRLPCPQHKYGGCHLDEQDCIYSHKCPDGPTCKKRSKWCWFNDLPGAHS